jgi:hypothetical protein
MSKMKKYVIESRGTQNKICKICSRIHISCSHLQMELNYCKTPIVSSAMHTKFVSTKRGCRAGIKN